MKEQKEENQVKKEIVQIGRENKLIDGNIKEKQMSNQHVRKTEMPCMHRETQR